MQILQNVGFLALDFVTPDLPLLLVSSIILLHAEIILLVLILVGGGSLRFRFGCAGRLRFCCWYFFLGNKSSISQTWTGRLRLANRGRTRLGLAWYPHHFFF